MKKEKIDSEKFRGLLRRYYKNNPGATAYSAAKHLHENYYADRKFGSVRAVATEIVRNENLKDKYKENENTKKTPEAEEKPAGDKEEPAIDTETAVVAGAIILIVAAMYISHTQK